MKRTLVTAGITLGLAFLLATPAKAATSKMVGFVKSVEGETIEVRMANGECQRFTLRPELVASSNLRPGSLVAFNANSDGVIATIETPVAEQTYSGVVQTIENDSVTLALDGGETYTTIIPAQTATRMNLAPGTSLSVTTYQGVPTTRICLGTVFKELPVQPVTIEEPPVFVRPPAPVTQPPVPVRALW